MKSAGKAATYGSVASLAKEQMNDKPDSVRAKADEEEEKRRRRDEKRASTPGSFVRTSDAAGGPMLKNIMGV